jgi:hypothetical protein
MWRILKTELVYHKSIFLIGIFILLCNQILYRELGPRPFTNLSINKPTLAGTFSFMLMIYMAVRIREKTEMIYAVLPLSKNQVGLTRLLFCLLSWAILSLFFMIMNLVLQPHLPIIVLFKRNLLLTILILILNTLPFLGRDIYYVLGGQYRKLWLAIWLFFIMAIFSVLFGLFVMPVDEYSFFNMLDDSQVITEGNVFELIVYMMLGLFLSVLSIQLFKARKSYLE